MALDVVNAFNSANWSIIIKVLQNKGVPAYLRHIIHDYLNNKNLLYGKGKNRKITNKLGYGPHIGSAAAKARQIASALERILSNVRGARHDKRKIMASIVQNQLLYGAPVWAEAFVYKKNVNTLLSPQRKIALRTALAYRTVSTEAILVISGIISFNSTRKTKKL